MEEIRLRDDFIRLGQALKAADLAGSGAQAKEAVQNGLVKVNQEVCTQRGKKLVNGDVVSFRGKEIKIVG